MPAAARRRWFVGYVKQIITRDVPAVAPRRNPELLRQYLPVLDYEPQVQPGDRGRRHAAVRTERDVQLRPWQAGHHACQGSIRRVSAEMPGSECCEHCAEIPLLREEVAALRARLNALTTLPPSASGPLPLQAEPGVAAKTPPRQMPLFGPVHGPGLPQVDHESSLQAKVGLYRALFAGRSDMYAYRWENTVKAPKAGRRNGGLAPPATTRSTCRLPMRSSPRT